MKAFLEENATKRARSDDFKVTYSWIDGKKKLSKQLMLDAGLNPEDFEEEGNGYSKLTVTPVKN